MRKMQATLTDRIIPALLGLLYPGECPECEGRTDNLSVSPICKSCWSGITQPQGPRCRVCSLPLGSIYAEVCGECIKDRPAFEHAVSYSTYTGTLREAVHQLKFKGVRRLAGPLGRLLAQTDLPEADVMLPVPLDTQKLRERGFNQSLLLALAISRETNIPVRTGLLMKIKKTPTQVGLRGRERRANLKRAFGVSEKLSGEKILLIDDVMTTGATARQCAKTLLKAGASKVSIATIARSV